MLLEMRVIITVEWITIKGLMAGSGRFLSSLHRELLSIILIENIINKIRSVLDQTSWTFMNFNNSLFFIRRCSFVQELSSLIQFYSRLCCWSFWIELLKHEEWRPAGIIFSKRWRPNRNLLIAENPILNASSMKMIKWVYVSLKITSKHLLDLWECHTVHLSLSLTFPRVFHLSCQQ